MRTSTKNVKYHAIIMRLEHDIAGFWRQFARATSAAAHAKQWARLICLTALCFACSSAEARRSENFSASEIGIIKVSELSPEARTVLRSIANGGPFRYPKDGAVFGNRERRLPLHP